jgi:hypothetical protein
MEVSQKYTSQGRTGYILYEDQLGHLKLNYEFGGGNCLAIIYIPAVQEWTSATSRPLSERTPLLNAIAEQAIIDQAPNCSYIISDRFIEIFDA